MLSIAAYSWMLNNDVLYRGKIPIVKEHAYNFYKQEIITREVGSPAIELKKPKVVDHMLDRANETAKISTPDLPVPNPTLFSDRFFVSLAPVFIIRHPIRMLSSYYRASRSFGADVSDADFPVTSSFRWSRFIYDSYEAHYKASEAASDSSEKWPIVIDGDELVDDPQGVMTSFCEVVGIDPDKVVYSWETREETQDATVPGPTVLGSMLSAFLGTMRSSSGVIKRAVRVPLGLWNLPAHNRE